MTGLWKINMVQNYTTKQEFNKLSFKKDDTFSARVLRLDGDTKDVIIKLLDGRVFPAKVEGFLNNPLDNYLFKFVVDGFDGGNLILKILSEQNKGTGEKNSEILGDLIDDLMKNLDFTVDKEDINILKGMLKHSIPLNEENFVEIKALNEFIEKANSSDDEVNSFINKYLNSKGVDENTPKGTFIKETLQSFFKEIGGLDLNKLLLMKENGIEFTEDNIKAFKNIVDKDFNLFNNIDEVKEFIKNEIQGNNKTMTNTNYNDAMTKNNILSKDNNNILNKDNNIFYKDNNIESNNSMQNPVKEEAIKQENEAKISQLGIEVEEKLEKFIKEDKAINRNEAIVKENKMTHKSEVIVKNENSILPSKEDTMVNSQLNRNSITEKLLKDVNQLFNFDNKINESIVKEEIKDKLNLLKTNISEMLKLSNNDSENISKIFNLLEGRFNEFKLFNTLNNNYYYLDIPVNVKEENYDCKLVIKDERAKGKKIDSNNIKIATSVSTIYMNTVDAYITVLNNSASIDIEAEAQFVKLLDIFKEKLLEDLSTNQYNFKVKIKERKQDFSFANCRTFFEDEDFSSLNVRV